MIRLRYLIAIAAAFAVAGCAGASQPQPRVVYQTVEKPVAVACVPNGLRPAPSGLLTRSDVAKLNGPQRYAAIFADWALRVARMNDTEPIILACSSTH